MAAMALQLRSKCRALQNPRLIQLFSTSSDSNGGEDKKESSSPSPSPASSYFSDVKASLKQSSPPRRVSPPPSSPPTDFPSFSPKPSKGSSLDEIRKNLSEFRLRSSVPPPSPTSSSSASSQTISFQELYKRNVIEKRDEGNNKSGKLPFEAIRESLRQLRESKTNRPQNDRFKGQDNRSSKLDAYSLKSFRENLKMRPDSTEASQHSRVIGGSEVLPSSIFSKETGEKSEAEKQAMKTEFVKMYSYDELGNKLAKLRPPEAKKEKSWFSLAELNERLGKLREMEEKEMDSKIQGLSFKDLRESLVKLRISADEKTKKSTCKSLPLYLPVTA